MRCCAGLTKIRLGHDVLRIVGVFCRSKRRLRNIRNRRQRDIILNVLHRASIALMPGRAPLLVLEWRCEARRHRRGVVMRHGRAARLCGFAWFCLRWIPQLVVHGITRAITLARRSVFLRTPARLQQILDLVLRKAFHVLQIVLSKLFPDLIHLLIGQMNIGTLGHLHVGGQFDLGGVRDLDLQVLGDLPHFDVFVQHELCHELRLGSGRSKRLIALQIALRVDVGFLVARSILVIFARIRFLFLLQVLPASARFQGCAGICGVIPAAGALRIFALAPAGFVGSNPGTFAVHPGLGRADKSRILALGGVHVIHRQQSIRLFRLFRPGLPCGVAGPSSLESVCSGVSISFSPLTCAVMPDPGMKTARQAGRPVLLPGSSALCATNLTPGMGLQTRMTRALPLLRPLRHLLVTGGFTRFLQPFAFR